MSETLAEAMTRVKGATDLAAYCDAHLERRGRGWYVCPVCGSGNNRGEGRGTAAFHTYKSRSGETRWHCSATCNSDGDIYDLAGILEKTEDRAEQCNAVAAWAGIEGWHRDGGAVDRGEAIGWNGTATVTDQQPTTVSQGKKAEQPTDHEQGRKRHRAYVLDCQKNIEHPEAVAYLAARGIDVETAKAWGLGYDPHHAQGWKDAAGEWHNGGRIVIPWKGSTFYHIDRATSEDVAQIKYSKPKADEVGKQPLWNPAALKADAFFVVEGALDALAVQACGYEAVAMGTAKANDLIGAMKSTAGVGVAVLLNDNDKAGIRAQEDLAGELRAAGLAYSTVNVSQMGAKDAFERYGRDRDGLASFLTAAYQKGLADVYASIFDALGVYDPATVTASLYTMDDVLAPIPTGISSIDEAIGGGLPARGLVVIGAVSSAGKTTLVHQVCENVAASGRPALFCSIEQGRQEVVAKSLSRIMATIARSNGARIVASGQAITNRDERTRWEYEDGEKSAAFTLACSIYHQHTHREDGTPTLYIMEPEQQPTVAQIRRAAEAIKKVHGQAPLVAVDYAQLLGAPKGLERGTDKQILDKNTLELRQLARDLPTCVIAISSLNRASYTGSIDLSSFKESGMLEYSSDLLLGMQPYGLQEAMAGKSEDSGAAKARAKQIMREYKEATLKQVELVILKNRNGGISKSPCLIFDGATSTFIETSGTTAKAKAAPARL